MGKASLVVLLGNGTRIDNQFKTAVFPGYCYFVRNTLIRSQVHLAYLVIKGEILKQLSKQGTVAKKAASANSTHLYYKP